jgi:hypothetical protein
MSANIFKLYLANFSTPSQCYNRYPNARMGARVTSVPRNETGNYSFWQREYFRFGPLQLASALHVACVRVLSATTTAVKLADATYSGRGRDRIIGERGPAGTTVERLVLPWDSHAAYSCVCIDRFTTVFQFLRPCCRTQSTAFQCNHG